LRGDADVNAAAESANEVGWSAVKAQANATQNDC
jgi:hypothetical protein